MNYTDLTGLKHFLVVHPMRQGHSQKLFGGGGGKEGGGKGKFNHTLCMFARAFLCVHVYIDMQN